MKAQIGKQLIADCKSRGYVEIDNCLYPPNSAEAERYMHEQGNLSTKKRKSLKTLKIDKIKTGWIDDYRNKNCLERKDLFTKLIEIEFGLTVWPEFHFSIERRYRFDYAIPIMANSGELKIAIEVQGGIWAKGNSGHSSGTGIQRDMDKSNLAQSLGWFVIKVTPQDLLTNKTLELIKSRL